MDLIQVCETLMETREFIGMEDAQAHLAKRFLDIVDLGQVRSAVRV